MLVSFLTYENLARLRLAKQRESRRDRTGIAFEERPKFDGPVDNDCSAKTIVRTPPGKLHERPLNGLGRLQGLRSAIEVGGHPAAQFVRWNTLSGSDNIGDHEYEVAARLPGNLRRIGLQLSRGPKADGDIRGSRIGLAAGDFSLRFAARSQNLRSRIHVFGVHPLAACVVARHPTHAPIPCLGKTASLRQKTPSRKPHESGVLRKI